MFRKEGGENPHKIYSSPLDGEGEEKVPDELGRPEYKSETHNSPSNTSTGKGGVVKDPIERFMEDF